MNEPMLKPVIGNIYLVDIKYDYVNVYSTHKPLLHNYQGPAYLNKINSQSYAELVIPLFSTKNKIPIIETSVQHCKVLKKDLGRGSPLLLLLRNKPAEWVSPFLVAGRLERQMDSEIAKDFRNRTKNKSIGYIWQVFQKMIPLCKTKKDKISLLTSAQKHKILGPSILNWKKKYDSLSESDINLSKKKQRLEKRINLIKELEDAFEEKEKNKEIKEVEEKKDLSHLAKSHVETDSTEDNKKTSTEVREEDKKEETSGIIESGRFFSQMSMLLEEQKVKATIYNNNVILLFRDNVFRKPFQHLPTILHDQINGMPIITRVASSLLDDIFELCNANLVDELQKLAKNPKVIARKAITENNTYLLFENVGKFFYEKISHLPALNDTDITVLKSYLKYRAKQATEMWYA